MATGLAVFHSGAVNLCDWNICLLIIGAVSIAYWFFHSPASSSPHQIGNFATLALPAYVALQVLPVPESFLTFASSGHRAIFDALHDSGLAAFAAPVSVTPAATFAYLFRIVGYLLVFFLVREFSSRSLQNHSWLPIAPLILIGCAEAMWGVIQRLQAAEVQGSYANRNHFAGLLEMVLPFILARVLAKSGRVGEEQGQLVRLAEISGLLLIAAVMLLALLYSESKMGLVSAITGLFVMGALWTLSRLRYWQRWIGLACIAGVCVFGLVFLPSDELVASFGGVMTSSHNAGEGRWPIWMDTVRLVRAFPLFGCGLGAYQSAFLKYQTSVIDNTFAFAHNDYLQLLAELGVAGSLIFAAAIGPIAIRPFRAVLRHSGMQVRYLALGCAGALAAIGLHSFADFNLYIPANATVFAWILGVASSLSQGPRAVVSRSTRNSSIPRNILLGLGLLVIIYAPAWIVFQSFYRNNVSAERAFCRFGICDTDAVIAAEKAAHNGSMSSVPALELERALRGDPASPYRWADLGDALNHSSSPGAAESFQNAVQFGPFIPQILLRAAAFDASRQKNNQAIPLTARILQKTNTYDGAIFDWYFTHHIPLQTVLTEALNGNRRASQAYFRFLINLGDLTGAAATWKWLLAHSYAEEPLAREYVALLAGQHDYEKAAQAWAMFPGPRADGYLETNWIYNGGFEAEPSGPMFDWEIQPRDTVTATLDTRVFHAGRRSLELQFAGKQNLDYQQVRQTVFVTPGAYRFEAYVRTDDITTDEGVGFRIFDPETPSRLNMMTGALRGTHDWTKITSDLAVTSPTQLLEIRVSRKPSLRFNCDIRGIAWIDSVRLARISVK